MFNLSTCSRRTLDQRQRFREDLSDGVHLRVVQFGESRDGVSLGVGTLDALFALYLVSQETVIQEPTHTRLVNRKCLNRTCYQLNVLSGK